MSLLHSLEALSYGPKSTLPASAKVFLYLRHRAIRDWTKRKQISKSEIMKETGLTLRTVERAIKSLEKDKMILVTRTQVGKIWHDNTYELHPDLFGDDYIYKPEKPNFKVIYGSKGHSSNNPKSLAKNEEPPTQKTVDPPTYLTVDPPTHTPGDDYDKYLDSLDNSLPKNPLKEPLKELFPKTFNFSSGEKTEEEINERRRILKNQAQMLTLKANPANEEGSQYGISS